MNSKYHDYLFAKHILVCDGESKEHAFETLFSLANLFNIRITGGDKLAQPDMIRTASRNLGLHVPDAFYRGFPRSVLQLSPSQRLFDQMAHYFRSYVAGDLSEAGHSLLENAFTRSAFREQAEIREFAILSEAEALEQLRASVEDLLCSSRPLSESQYDLVLSFIRDYRFVPAHCASKDTAVQLLLDTRDPAFTAFLQLSDVIRLLDRIQYDQYRSTDLKKLNLKNQDRKFLASVLDTFFREGDCNIRDCFEKRRLWVGLLHHIHYVPVNAVAREFAELMRSGANQSVYAQFEALMAQNRIQEAAEALRKGKGSGAVLRNLNYILSRCKAQEEVEQVIRRIRTGNAILLLQLMQQYAHDDTADSRTFKFTRHNLLKVHKETQQETASRQSRVSGEVRQMVSAALRKNLQEVLKNRLGKVYLDPALAGLALPLQEATGSGGFGVLPRGSRVPLGDGKKVRCFTYWEEVDDIDLSCFGLTDDNQQIEFSWRTMWNRQSHAVTYSGDQTRGYHGGSEYFDIRLDAIREEYPAVQYMIFCNNVFSGAPFSRCLCKAGFMRRDVEDSGEIFEPKTVSTSFQITCESTFAYLFALDVRTGEMVWLNLSRDSQERVAGCSDLDFLLQYLDPAGKITQKELFTMMASQLVDTPQEADVVVSDQVLELAEGVEQIHSYDTDRILALMNG